MQEKITAHNEMWETLLKARRNHAKKTKKES